MIKQFILTIIFSLTCLFGFSQKKHNVYVFIAEKCPISIYMAKPLNEAVKQFGDEVDFYAVFPMKNSTEKTAKKFLDKYKMENFKIKLDKYQGFARKLGATITPEMVVTNEAGEILYRGRISDAYNAPGRMKHGIRKNELTGILKKLNEGQDITEPWMPAVGCYITFYN